MAPRQVPSTRRTLRPPSWSTCSLEHLADEALLSLLFSQTLNASTLDVARRLLDFAGSLDGLARLAPTIVAKQSGIGPARSVRLHAAFELGHRRRISQAGGDRFDSLESVLTWARPRLLPLDHEEVWLLCLDGRNSMRNSRRIAQGGHHSCALTAKDILRPALRDGASSIILVHNHPSGDPTPSDADVNMTAQIDLACAAVGLPLLDHVVVAAEGAASMLELGVVRAR